MIKEIRNSQPSDMVRIEYMLGNLCNHKCHYCFPGSNEGDQPWPDIGVVKENLGHFLQYYKDNGKPKSNLYFVGGEPTLWKGLPELCSYLKENFDILIEMSTNGSRSLGWWDKEGHNFDQLTISVHHEYAKLDHIVNLCDMLYEKDVFINADVLIDPFHFEKCKDIVEYLLTKSKNNWPIVAKIVHFNGMHKYTQEQLEYFENTTKRFPDLDWLERNHIKHSREVTIVKDNDESITVNNDSWITRNNLNYFRGWECNLGVDFVKIFGDGRITGNCQQTLYGYNFDYNLYDKDFRQNFNPVIKPVICSKPICGCSEEIVCKKRKVNV